MELTPVSWQSASRRLSHEPSGRPSLLSQSSAKLTTTGHMRDVNQLIDSGMLERDHAAEHERHDSQLKIDPFWIEATSAELQGRPTVT